jgi:hypothetical protein
MDPDLGDVAMALLIQRDVGFDEPLEVPGETFYLQACVFLESVGQVTVATAERDLHGLLGREESRTI